DDHQGPLLHPKTVHPKHQHHDDAPIIVSIAAKTSLSRARISSVLLAATTDMPTPITMSAISGQRVWTEVSRGGFEGSSPASSGSEPPLRKPIRIASWYFSWGRPSSEATRAGRPGWIEWTTWLGKEVDGSWEGGSSS